MEASPLFGELAQALRTRLAVIGDTHLRATDPAEQLRQLQQASERIVALQDQLPRPLDPQLAHFLQRCSYDKALAWLEGSREHRA